MRRKHDRKKRSSPVLWSFILTLLLIAAISAALGLFRTAEEPVSAPASTQEPEPVGTPTQAPTVDQRPVPAAGAASVPSAANAPADTAASSGLQEDASDPGTAPSGGAAESTPVFDAKDGEQMVRGVIVDATTSTVTIQTADGTRLSFMRETADVTGRIVEEAEAEVYYVGSISGTDTSAVFVTKIISFA